ncbi:saccharopine dehydrogenase family protein [Plantactinospora sp. KLBMP9567]|uniref:saccharopine dehydrogenase family protein n=1 Tax=Plantactinospora sp. KLBMP9567 TaxID=3085900 RepID=UPI0029819E68|nr:saccharopine dehydrogenase NADP-binding domain-containing protein [Plantactinospora sp. KLBMP9567]MDW5324905.1 saccharopine dehydrogenase NADP-binding domain-containing protein [Plantactinospora sp. KLBMP9567]
MRIAVYGASGYQAGLVLAELTRRGVEPVLVGRDAARLHRAATRIGITGAGRRVAGADDHRTLVAALRDCDAVVNCAGPFTDSGHSVVRAAVAAGCQYVDTAGEQVYLSTVFDTFAGPAERAGVTVVPAANDACLPADLLARLLADTLGPVEEIVVSHFITGGGGPSRGSLRSLGATVDVIRGGGLTYQSGAWRTGVPPGRTSVTLPGASEPTEVTRFPLAEVVTIPRHVPVGRVESFAEAGLGAALSAPLPPEVIDALPEGPDEEGRRGQRFSYLVDAVGVEGRRVRGVVRGSDTYGSTAVIAVEAARRLVADGARPGVLAPAQAYDPRDFLDFLAPYGIRWWIGDADG